MWPQDITAGSTYVAVIYHDKWWLESSCTEGCHYFYCASQTEQVQMALKTVD